MTLISIAAIVVILVVCLALGRAAWLWWKFRGDRVVTCPENERPAGVVVNAGRVAAHALSGSPDLRLSSCSRWPERAGCGQQCLSQVAAAPEDCLVRNILVRWYDGKSCAVCGEPIGEIIPGGAKPALLSADKVSMEWSEVPASRLPETLAAAAPICFACHMSNMLVRTHPELAIDRHRAVERSAN